MGVQLEFPFVRESEIYNEAISDVIELIEKELYQLDKDMESYCEEYGQFIEMDVACLNALLFKVEKLKK